MKKFTASMLWVILLFLLILPPSLFVRANAQVGESLNGCSPDQFSLIMPTTQLNYAAGCQTYTRCADEGVALQTCQMRAFMTLRQACSDGSCEIEAALYAAVMPLFDIDYFSVYLWDGNPEAVWERVLLALSSFQNGNDLDAVSLFRASNLDGYINPVFSISMGLIYGHMGEQDRAMAEYDHAVELMYSVPLTYYLRGHLYLSQQEVEAAAVDFALLSQYGQEDIVLAPLAGSLTYTYPIETVAFEEWVVYPILGFSAGPGGDFYYDATPGTSYNSKLMWIDNQSRLIVYKLRGDINKNLAPPHYNFPDYVTLTKSTDAADSFSVSYSDIWGEANLTLNFASDPVQLIGKFNGFESHSYQTFLVSRLGETDPRQFLGVPRCPGAALSLLKVGERGKGVGFSSQPPDLYDQPLGTTTNGSVYNFTLLDGPSCVGGQAWWQVQTDDGRTGWVNQNWRTDVYDYTNYIIYPLEDIFFPPYCNVTLPPHLTIGASGSVIPGLNFSNLRPSPDTSAAKIGILPERAIFEVLMGPVCADGYAWWQVRYQELIGWTAEGQGYTYWLQPES